MENWNSLMLIYGRLLGSNYSKPRRLKLNDGCYPHYNVQLWERAFFRNQESGSLDTNQLVAQEFQLET